MSGRLQLDHAVAELTSAAIGFAGVSLLFAGAPRTLVVLSKSATAF